MKVSLWLLLYSVIQLAGLPLQANDKTQWAAVLACRQEPAPLLRLDCYDNALNAAGQPPLPLPAQTGAIWQRAMAHERKRDDHSTSFLVTAGGGDNPQVTLTTPAIGAPPPRPVLMLSCIDNITRMQVALVAPLREEEGSVVLSTEQGQIKANWFVRENGFVLESSRGLPGIDEIKQLFGGKTLTLTASGGAARLVFNIAGLAQEIEPLRRACHW